MEIIQNNHEEMSTRDSVFAEVVIDNAFNIETQWYLKAKEAGIPRPVLMFLKERICSHLLDAGKAQDDPVRHRLQGRAAELQELLGLFSV